MGMRFIPWGACRTLSRPIRRIRLTREKEKKLRKHRELGEIMGGKMRIKEIKQPPEKYASSRCTPQWASTQALPIPTVEKIQSQAQGPFFFCSPSLLWGRPGRSSVRPNFLFCPRSMVMQTSCFGLGELMPFFLVPPRMVLRKEDTVKGVQATGKRQRTVHLRRSLYADYDM